MPKKVSLNEMNADISQQEDAAVCCMDEIGLVNEI